MPNRTLNQYTKEELQKMFDAGRLDYCPRCKKYHEKGNDDFPFSNMKLCTKCEEDISDGQ